MRNKLKSLCLFILLVLHLGLSSQASARLEVCNQTDLVLMVAIGYDTAKDRKATEGWWRLYPGYCEVPVDVAMLKGNYYLHAESNPRSTMPDDAFSWGEQSKLCVKLADFRMPNATQCGSGNVFVGFNELNKNWRNKNVVNIVGTRRYENQFRTKMAGVQRLLSLLGNDVGDIDGVAGQKTVEALNNIASANGVFGFDFEKLFPLLERLIASKQKLDN